MTWVLLERVGSKARWRCTACGVVTNPTGVSPEKIWHRCLAAPSPGAGADLSTFGRGLAEHVAAGEPKTTEPQRLARLAICQSCPSGRFNPALHSCEELGGGCCNGKARLSKVVDWADQSCPLGHWERIPPVDCCNGPSLVQQACNFTVAAVKHLAGGAELLPLVVVEARYAVCRTCPFASPDVTSCRECGCRISGAQSHFNKCAIPTEDCPRGFWPAKK